MGEAIGESLPIAVGVLVSPMPIVALLALLLGVKMVGDGVGSF